MTMPLFLLEYCSFSSSPLLLQSSYLRPLRSLFDLLFLHDHHLAMPASGGMMGGSSFSSSTFSSNASGGMMGYSSDSSDCSSPARYSRRTSSRVHMKAANEVKANGKLAIIVANFLFVLVFWDVVFFVCPTVDSDPPQKSVVMLQVGSLATGRSLQKDLNRIADVADTSSKKGWHFVLQESRLSSQYYLYFGTPMIAFPVDVKSSVVECEDHFNQLSIDERSKFDEETLVNVNNIRKKSATSQRSNGLSNEYIVVTIIVAAHVVPELPPIESSAQLKKALQILAFVPSSNIMAVQVLWTPQREDDSLTEQKLLKDYPLLRPL
ncbi:hypothetical protein M8C21_008396 [Ambrosia artemisiifolia]|uniref:Uncharacterized protein n=1 Tax=Ambrosia artemisiifolia TaxID=4212 RepID=A0AAD5C193_AMBAR|nr:hypothetical protein M8C21_008396 [Ambrosia artemisiifolia]